MADIAKIKLPNDQEYNIKDAEAIANITESNKIVTITKRNGTVSSFSVGYPVVTSATNGLMSAIDKGLLDDIEEALSYISEYGDIVTSQGKLALDVDTTLHTVDATLLSSYDINEVIQEAIDNHAVYAHSVTNKGSAFNSGLYKITTNSQGHVTSATAVQKSDITALGIPSSDTTYSAVSTSADGLMTASDKIKLNSISSGSNISGSGTSGYLTKWSGTNGITNGPALGNSSSTFLTNDGTWNKPVPQDAGFYFVNIASTGTVNSSTIKLVINKEAPLQGSYVVFHRYKQSGGQFTVPTSYSEIDLNFTNGSSTKNYTLIRTGDSGAYSGTTLAPSSFNKMDWILCYMTSTWAVVLASSNIATTDVATTSENGLMSSTDKSRLDQMWQAFNTYGLLAISSPTT